MSAGQKFALALVVVVAFVGLAAFVIWWIIPPPVPINEEVAACYRILPDNRKAGVSIEFDKDGNAKINLSGEVGTPNVPTAEQLKAFRACLNDFLGVVDIGATARQPAAPIGQVADTWNGQNGLNLTLMPSKDDIVLNNLRFGPDVGSKAEIAERWCAEFAACVTCKPSSPTDDTPEVLIELTNVSKAVKVQMAGIWPPPMIDPKTGKAKGELWQLVEPDGRRFYFECPA